MDPGESARVERALGLVADDVSVMHRAGLTARELVGTMGPDDFVEIALKGQIAYGVDRAVLVEGIRQSRPGASAAIRMLLGNTFSPDWRERARQACAIFSEVRSFLTSADLEALRELARSLGTGEPLTYLAIQALDPCTCVDAMARETALRRLGQRARQGRVTALDRLDALLGATYSADIRSRALRALSAAREKLRAKDWLAMAFRCCSRDLGDQVCALMRSAIRSGDAGAIAGATALLQRGVSSQMRRTGAELLAQARSLDAAQLTALGGAIDAKLEGAVPRRLGRAVREAEVPNAYQIVGLALKAVGLEVSEETTAKELADRLDPSGRATQRLETVDPSWPTTESGIRRRRGRTSRRAHVTV